MTELTRRRDPKAHQETWRVFYGDGHVGTIARSVAIPAPPRNGSGAGLLSGQPFWRVQGWSRRKRGR